MGWGWGGMWGWNVRASVRVKVGVRGRGSVGVGVGVRVKGVVRVRVHLVAAEMDEVIREEARRLARGRGHATGALPHELLDALECLALGEVEGHRAVCCRAELRVTHAPAHQGAGAEGGGGWRCVCVCVKVCVGCGGEDRWWFRAAPSP